MEASNSREGPRIQVQIDPVVRARFPGIRLAVRMITLESANSDYDLEAWTHALAKKIGLTLEQLKESSIVRAYRDFYWRIGIDPTKVRPSGEALLRRIVGGKGLPKINVLVDAGNLASAETLVPIGIYDLDRIEGPLLLRWARPGEAFQDITGSTRSLEGRELVLSDSKGPLHIFPHRDSLRTKITEGTKRALIVACGVDGVEERMVERAADKVLEFYTLLNRGVKP